MALIPSLLFIAQALLMPSPVLAPAVGAPPAHRLSGHHSHASPTPAPSPQVRITIVNATSVPAIGLSISGKDLPMAYPSFPQGMWTANAPLKTPSIHYLVRSMDGSIVADRSLTFQPVSSQILLLTGDLSTSGPAEIPPQLGLPPPPGPKPWLPNLQFHIYPVVTGTNDLCRYRVVNGMPSKLLILRSISEPNKPSRQLALLAPGNSALFVHQPANLQWDAEIDGAIYRIAIEQEGERKNCLIPFFLRNGRPDFIRVFENP